MRRPRSYWWLPLLFAASALDVRAAEPEITGVEGAGHACIALAVFGEARGESYLGQAMVARVILNRLARDPARYEDPCDVVNKLNQFHALRDWAFPRNPGAIDQRAWIKAIEVTQAVATGDYLIAPPACAEATHFYRIDSPRPDWAASMDVVCAIDDHVFLREVQ